MNQKFNEIRVSLYVAYGKMPVYHRGRPPIGHVTMALRSATSVLKCTYGPVWFVENM